MLLQYFNDTSQAHRHLLSNLAEYVSGLATATQIMAGKRCVRSK